MISPVSIHSTDLTAQSEDSLLETAADLGRKGAAFAALGEMPVDFFPLALAFSVADKKDGVKLGESTLNVFFILPSLVPGQWWEWYSPTCPLPTLHWQSSSDHEQMRSLCKAHQSPFKSTSRQGCDGLTFSFELATPIYGDITTELCSHSSSQHRSSYCPLLFSSNIQLVHFSTPCSRRIRSSFRLSLRGSTHCADCPPSYSCSLPPSSSQNMHPRSNIAP